MAAMKDRRSLTQEEKDAAKNLKAIYERKKKEWKLQGRNLTQDLIAGEFEWSGQSAVAQYLNANIPLNYEAASKFANFFNVSLKDISEDLAADWPSATISTPNTSIGPLYKGKIPLISWVQAGAWQEVADSYQENDAEDWVLCNEPHSSKAFALRVSGESMRNPGERKSFDDGDIIHVDPERPVENGSLVVVQINGDTEATFKQLIIESGRKYLKALNPNWPHPILEMPQDSTISGVVIGKNVSFI